jgi:splicing factor 3B subunit 3
VKDVIDGDLCSQYPAQAAAKQKSIAEEIDRTPGEILKKLEDMRNKVL